MDRAAAVEHFKNIGFDAEDKDGILYVNYDGIHDSALLMGVVETECRNIGYNCSFGVKSKEKGTAL